jgi:hypothetical protein
MTGIHVTKHARKRIENDKRTQLSVCEVTRLIGSSEAIRVKQTHYVYSPKDNKTLKVITARQGKTLVTVFDTNREPTQLGDMIARARAGVAVPFANLPTSPTLDQEHGLELTLGTYKLRKRRKTKVPHLDITELWDVGTVFLKTDHDRDLFEDKFVHEMVVEGTKYALESGELSKTQTKKLCFFIEDRKNRRIGYMPVWVSHTLLGLGYSGGLFLPNA